MKASGLLTCHNERPSSRPAPSNEDLYPLRGSFMVRLAARGYYVTPDRAPSIISCHQAPHRTVLALFTHTAPH